MPDFQKPQSDIGVIAGSPKLIYTNYLLGLCKNYFETARSGDNIDRATAALIAFYPEAKVQEELWRYYTDERKRLERSNDGDAAFTASCRAVGKMVVNLAETLEFVEKSTGGFL